MSLTWKEKLRPVSLIFAYVHCNDSQLTYSSLLNLTLADVEQHCSLMVRNSWYNIMSTRLWRWGIFNFQDMATVSLEMVSWNISAQLMQFWYPSAFSQYLYVLKLNHNSPKADDRWWFVDISQYWLESMVPKSFRCIITAKPTLVSPSPGLCSVCWPSVSSPRLQAEVEDADTVLGSRLDLWQNWKEVRDGEHHQSCLTGYETVW